MPANKQTPRLPKNPQPGAEVCDRYGNRWLYDGKQDSWVSKGVLSTPVAVSETQDGIIAPTTLNQLNQLRSLAGLEQRPLKILPGRDAYWYYFHSSDKSFKFSPEGEDQLRLEVDRGRLFYLLTKYQCQGPRGDTGNQGPRGYAGSPGPAEVCYEPEIAATRLDFAIFTPTPLPADHPEIALPDGHVPDIAVRIYRVVGQGQAQSLDAIQHQAAYYYQFPAAARSFQRTRDILVNQNLGVIRAQNQAKLSNALAITPSATIGGSPVVTVLVDPTGQVAHRVTSSPRFPVDVERTIASISFDPVTNIVSGSVFLRRPWLDKQNATYCVRSRQCGPDGARGAAGVNSVKVSDCALDSTSVFATCPIVSARLDCAEQEIFTVCSNLLDLTCVDQVKFLPNAGSLSDRGALSATFAAAQMVIEDCKFIESYQVILPEDDEDENELQLSHWAPQAGCVTRRHYDRHTFPWIRQTDIGACDSTVKWYGVDVVRNAKYPWAIVKGQAPEKDECCQEDFFYCPNIQNGACSSEQAVGSQP